jgi:hypothetical protein
MRSVNESEENVQIQLLEKMSSTCAELEAKDAEVNRLRMEASSTE